jgi:hypothetical protein
MITPKYMMSDGKVYEVVGKDGQGYPVCRLTKLKEIPEDKPLNAKEETTDFVMVDKTDEVKPRRGRRKA